MYTRGYVATNTAPSGERLINYNIYIRSSWLNNKICNNTRLHLAYCLPFLQWAQQHNVLDLELPDQLPDISPGRLQWSLGSYIPTTF